VIDDDIRQVIAQYARLYVDVGVLADDTDLFRAGMTSHGTVNLMMGLEEHFNVEFTDEMLGRTTFESIASIREALLSLGVNAG
jgi:acyl carrier protein